MITGEEKRRRDIRRGEKVEGKKIMTGERGWGEKRCEERKTAV
jgi:hypothetical protein